MVFNPFKSFPYQPRIYQKIHPHYYRITCVNFLFGQSTLTRFDDWSSLVLFSKIPSNKSGPEYIFSLARIWKTNLCCKNYNVTSTHIADSKLSKLLNIILVSSIEYQGLIKTRGLTKFYFPRFNWIF